MIRPTFCYIGSVSLCMSYGIIRYSAHLPLLFSGLASTRSGSSASLNISKTRWGPTINGFHCNFTAKFLHGPGGPEPDLHHNGEHYGSADDLQETSPSQGNQRSEIWRSRDHWSDYQIEKENIERPHAGALRRFRLYEDDEPTNERANEFSMDDAKAEVRKALREDDTYKLLSSISEACNDLEYIASIPTPTFMEIFRCLDTEVFIEPFQNIYRDIPPQLLRNLETEIFGDHLSILQHIVRQRLECPRKIGIGEYKLLLNIARAARDGRSAFMIWYSMGESQVSPDTVCYNHFFEALCWTHTFDQYEVKMLRTTDFNLRRRRRKREDWPRSPWKTRIGYRTGPRGLKAKVTNMFTEMVHQGLVGDTKTFTLLMLAFSREGDLEGVNSILKKVWGIDGDVIMQMELDPVMTVHIPIDSPVYPTTDLLFAVAHVYGSNHDVPKAMRVVDYVSRRFELDIPTQVWAELLEWTFVLSSPRSRANQHFSDFGRGWLPKESVESLWDTLVQRPYNCEPTWRMYSHYIKNFWRLEKPDLMLSAMISRLHVYRDLCLKYQICRQNLGRLEASSQLTPVQYAQESLSEVRHRLRLARLERYRALVLLRNWFKWSMLPTDKRPRERFVLWQRQIYPLCIEVFWSFRQRSHFIGYPVESGYVQILTHEEGDHITYGSEKMKQEYTILMSSQSAKTKSEYFRSLADRAKSRSMKKFQSKLAKLSLASSHRLRHLPLKRREIQLRRLYNLRLHAANAIFRSLVISLQQPRRRWLVLMKKRAAADARRAHTLKQRRTNAEFAKWHEHDDPEEVWASPPKSPTAHLSRGRYTIGKRSRAIQRQARKQGLDKRRRSRSRRRRIVRIRLSRQQPKAAEPSPLRLSF